LGGAARPPATAPAAGGGAAAAPAAGGAPARRRPLRCGLLSLLAALSLCAGAAQLARLRAAARGPAVDVAAVVVKDEADALRAWLAWHSAIFGAQNVVAVDQESSDTAALAALAAHERAGGVVVWRVADYNRKGDHALAALRRAQATRAVRLFFPLDVDEFVAAAAAGGGVARTAAAVRCAVDAAAASGDLRYEYGSHWQSFLADAGASFEQLTTWADAPMLAGWAKKFFRADALLALDHGNHFGTVLALSAPARAVPALRLLHAHYRSVAATVKKAADDVAGFGFDRPRVWCWRELLGQAPCFAGDRVGEERLTEHLRGLPPGLPGAHKVANLLGFRERGAAHFVRPAGPRDIALPTMAEMLRGWGEADNCTEAA